MDGVAEPGSSTPPTGHQHQSGHLMCYEGRTSSRALDSAWGGAEGTAVGDHRRGHDPVAAGPPPIEGQALAQPTPQPTARPEGEGAVQRGEEDTREPAGNAPLHAAESQGPD